MRMMWSGMIVNKENLYGFLAQLDDLFFLLFHLQSFLEAAVKKRGQKVPSVTCRRKVETSVLILKDLISKQTSCNLSQLSNGF